MSNMHNVLAGGTKEVSSSFYYSFHSMKSQLLKGGYSGPPDYS